MGNLKEYIEKNIDFLKELEREQDNKNIYNIENNKNIFTTLHSETLSKIVKELRNCDEFSNVEKINFVSFPNFLVDSQTNIPINEISLKIICKPIQEIDENNETIKIKLETEVVKDSIPLGTKVVSVETYKIDENTKFNNEIDVYNINIIKNYKKDSILDKGIWKFPTVYREKTWEDIDEIKILFSEMDMRKSAEHELKNEIFLNEEEKNKAIKTIVKQSIIEKVSNVLDNEPNIPFEYLIQIGCSPRSIQKTNII